MYVTFKGNPSNVNVSYGVNGAALSGTDLPYAFTASNWSNSATLKVATFVPDSVSEGRGWDSMCLRFDTTTNTVATTFEINDISILYRLRPIR